MIRNILIPLDGSSLAERSLPLAKAIANKSGSNITLLRVANPGDDTDVGLYLADVSSRFSLDDQGSQTTATGDTAETIVSIAEESSDMIAMTTRGRSGLARGLLGSITNAVIRSTSIPVLITRNDSDLSQGEVTIDNVICPLDGSELAEEVLMYAAELAGLFSARLTLFHVAEPFRPTSAMTPSSEHARTDSASVLKDAKNYLERKLADLDTSNLETRVEVILGRASIEIIKAVDSLPNSMIAMSTSGRSGIKRWTLGSVADSVIRGASSPTLVLRPSPA